MRTTGHVTRRVRWLALVANHNKRMGEARCRYLAHLRDFLQVREAAEVLLQLAFVARLRGVTVDALQAQVVLQAADVVLVVLLQTQLLRNIKKYGLLFR